jgi:1D-myo-inositol-tetrakisphosphate 5-kinase/inositol-polyphosphate multikinase
MPRLKYSTIPLASQVGGHTGVQTSEDGSLIFKPAVPLELQFYQSALTNPVLAPLRPFIPKFYGTLKLEGQIDIERTAAAADIAVTDVHHETLGPKDK